LNTDPKVADPAGPGTPYVVPGPGAGKLSFVKYEVGLYVVASTSGPSSGMTETPASLTVNVTFTAGSPGELPLVTPSMSKNAAPVGPTSTMARSDGKVWERLLNVTVTLPGVVAIFPLNPATVISDG